METNVYVPSEYDKLVKYLDEHGYIISTEGDVTWGSQVIVYDKNGNRLWDAVCNSMSYGNKEGLLEIAGTLVRNRCDEVEGYLTADDIIARLEEG